MQSTRKTDPVLIQGGMGVAVSGWQLARAVSQRGQLGVVSGTAIESVMVRRLQDGDSTGDVRRALGEFPYAPMAQRILERYFIRGGKGASQPYAATTILPMQPTRQQLELVVVANFVEVYLAKEGHAGLVGINLLEKIQTPTLPSLYGAMLADVDYVLMGAGIPRAIPGILDQLAEGEPTRLSIHVEGAIPGDDFHVDFSPELFTHGEVPWLRRPKFLAIVSSATLATMLARKSSGKVDGFVVEGPKAGGHNAPPRGAMVHNEIGEPVYGEKDLADLSAFRKLGLPFWLAGTYGTPDKLEEAINEGASGIQVGTAFAFCDESGLDAGIKRRVIELVTRGQARVFTDPLASPTGFPFKILELDGTLSDRALCSGRQRVCDLGYLRHAYRKDDGSVGWRCPGEPTEAFLRKGGCATDAVGRKCICNSLMAAIGQGQCRRSGAELPLVTCGNEINSIADFLLSRNALGYSAEDVIDRLLANPAPSELLTL